MPARCLYFAYGSNLSVDAMRERCRPRSARKLGAAVLLDHRLEFRADAHGFGLATVRPARGVRVYGGLWRIDRNCRAHLDRYEAWPRVYLRKDVPVLFQGRLVRALTYVLQRGGAAVTPERDYLETILAGYRDFNLPFAPLMQAVTPSPRLAESPERQPP
ncbi:MAG TPA: gamma-glutamylcyclotransferase family protein [Bacillota bacterium]|nr:gamma-glutamylcyclotransferase family protein [Bacillota bacterium]